jgi:hypothetical protein
MGLIVLIPGKQIWACYYSHFFIIIMAFKIKETKNLDLIFDVHFDF